MRNPGLPLDLFIPLEAVYHFLGEEMIRENPPFSHVWMSLPFFTLLKS
jgi:hypothetical protein